MSEPPVDAQQVPPVQQLVVLVSVPGGVPDLDQPLEEIIARSPEMATRVRIPLALYDPSAQSYESWLKVSWVVEFREQRLAATLRNDLDDFLRAWVKAHA